MPPQVASLICWAFILWLVVRDIRKRPEVSHAIWLPILWLSILGSRPISLWLNVSAEFQGSSDPNLEGSPFDRAVYMLLIFIGLIIVARRGASWRQFVACNKWLFALYVYFGISIIWSDYPFISLKRWIKECGDIVMVMIVLTEADPVSALQAVGLRCTYFLVPLSVLFIKYYPDIGRYYNRWTWTYSYGGVTLDKNALGSTLIVFGIFLFCHFLELWERRKEQRNKLALAGNIILLIMSAWLLFIANSSTSVVCTLLGILFILTMRVDAIRVRINGLAAYGIALALALIFLQLTVNLGDFLVGLVGRDLTFTGRTEIWRRLLEVKTNPLVGVGYYAFWLGDRVKKVSEGFYYDLNEAHNGYLETYLDGGLIALVLLLGVLAVTFKRLLRETANGGDAEAVKLAFLMIGAFYNWTEVAFARLCMIWVMFLLMIINFPPMAQSNNWEEIPDEENLDDEHQPAAEPSLENTASV